MRLYSATVHYSHLEGKNSQLVLFTEFASLLTNGESLTRLHC